ncbi:hypothetical protein Tco_0174833 [Tanacetum coccineum]
MVMGTADEIVKVPEKGPVFMEDLSKEEQVAVVEQVAKKFDTNAAASLSSPIIITITSVEVTKFKGELLGMLYHYLTNVSGPLSTTIVTHNATTLTEHDKYSYTPIIHQQVQTIWPDKCAQLETTFINSVEHLTINATYKENTVIHTSRRNCRIERADYTKVSVNNGDKDGDMILIACDSDLMESVNDFKLPNDQTIIDSWFGQLLRI